MNLSELGLDSRLLDGIDSIGWTETTPIQEKAIPIILKGGDIIASAQTGTGKTAAFLIPVVNKILAMPKEPSVKALIIVPTRELAIQIDQIMEGLSYFTPVSSTAIYGGRDGTSFANEQRIIKEGVDILIGTPGKIIAHLNMEHLNPSKIKFLILDEADRMLDIGFYEDIIRIISSLPTTRQTLLFSATLPPRINSLANSILKDPQHISIAISKPPEKIKQSIHYLEANQKTARTKKIIQEGNYKRVIIFCSTKSSTKSVARELKSMHMSVEDIHSDLEQSQREFVLQQFRNSRISILVATDILSRGIDVEDIELIINYDIPKDPEDYVHRIGRTARAERDGAAVTLVGKGEQRNVLIIERLLGKVIDKVGEPFEEARIQNKKRPFRGKGRQGRSSKGGGRDRR